jgi:hypothetical protein
MGNFMAGVRQIKLSERVALTGILTISALAQITLDGANSINELIQDSKEVMGNIHC